MNLVQNRPKSAATYEKLCKVIPGGVNSPVRCLASVSMKPLIADFAYGDTVVDVDGNHFIDYCMSWGAHILGHAHPEVIQKTIEQVRKGSSYGMTTAYEEILAKKITDTVKSCEKIRFVSSGTEATMSAVRLARGYTKRSKVITFSGCYHGHADYFLVQAGSGVTALAASSSQGIPEELVQSTVNLAFNDCEALLACFENPEIRQDLACVIIEPIACNMGVVPASQKFLSLLRSLTKEVGALLIFDEVVTGFRIGVTGAQSYYNITPDLTTFGKIIGGGFPMACFGGRAEIMDELAPLGSVYQAGTLSGNPVAVTSATQVFDLIQRPNFYDELEEKAQIIVTPVRRLIDEEGLDACVQSVGSLFTIFFGRKSVQTFSDAKTCDTDTFTRFFHSMFNHGIYMSPSQYEANFVSAAHTLQHLEKTRDAICGFLVNH